MGGAGYIGGEVLRLLTMHPEAEVVSATSQRYAGKRVTLVHPNLRGFTDLRFSPRGEEGDVEVVFLCLPHGESSKVVLRYVESGIRVIDTGADFRLHDPDAYAQWYGGPHPHPELLERFVYGLPEIHRGEIRRSTCAAIPGCIATSLILPLYPLCKEGLITPEVVADAKIGSSAGGRMPGESTHHPERSGSVRLYSPLRHRHSAEVRQECGVEGLVISAHAIEMVRGIQSTIHAKMCGGADGRAVHRAYRTFYGRERFIRIVRERRGVYRYPEPKIVSGTNLCDIGFEVDGDDVVVVSAIDNLVRGGAGSAVQCANLMFGLEEGMGLWYPGLHP